MAFTVEMFPCSEAFLIMLRIINAEKTKIEFGSWPVKLKYDPLWNNYYFAQFS